MLPVFPYGCETWCHFVGRAQAGDNLCIKTVRSAKYWNTRGQRFRRGYKQLGNEQLYGVHCTSGIIRVSK
jgi:hypothetical protein